MPPDVAVSPLLGRWVAQEVVLEEVVAHELALSSIDQVTPGALGGLVERVTAGVTIPEPQARAYYLRNADLFRRPESRRVRHILVDNEHTALEVAGMLHAGEPMDALARAVSIDAGSRARDGDLGEIGREQFAGQLGDLIFSAQVGAIVGPVRTEHGWHVARVDGVTPESRIAYDDARPGIVAELLVAERRRLFDAWLERRRSELVTLEPDYSSPADPATGTLTHRH